MRHEGLSSEGNDIALREAQAIGLPNDWTVEWNNNDGCKVWISPTGFKVYNLPRTIKLAKSNVSTSQENVAKR
jgi:hypothetical protein